MPRRPEGFYLLSQAPRGYICEVLTWTALSGGVERQCLRGAQVVEIATFTVTLSDLAANRDSSTDVRWVGLLRIAIPMLLCLNLMV